jgi:hypothetical protein
MCHRPSGCLGNVMPTCEHGDRRVQGRQVGELEGMCWKYRSPTTQGSRAGHGSMLELMDHQHRIETTSNEKILLCQAWAHHGLLSCWIYLLLCFCDTHITSTMRTSICTVLTFSVVLIHKNKAFLRTRHFHGFRRSPSKLNYSDKHAPEAEGSHMYCCGQPDIPAT